MERISRDKMFMEIAKIVALRGTCNRAYVGAVLVKNNRAISMGYNGSPAGERHCDDIGHRMVDGHCVATLHAEDNCIEFAKKMFPYGITGCTLYVTHFPCSKCTMKILSAEPSVSINRIVFLDDYGPTVNVSRKLLEEAGISVERFVAEPVE